MSKVKKVKKRRICWRDLMFHLHRKSLSEAFTLFVLDHPNMSKNRCAYYVLKTYYSTTVLKLWRDLYERDGYDYDLILGLREVNAYGM